MSLLSPSAASTRPMTDCPPIELVVASFDDPILRDLRAEQEPGPGGFPAADAGIVFLVARRAADPIGCAGLRGLGDDTAEVVRVYLRKAHRGPDVPRLLLAGVEDLARRRGFATTRLAACDGDIGLCESTGYVRIPPFGRHPPDAACFEKSLSRRP